MFRTLNYIWKLFWKRPSRRVFFIFFRMLKTEIKCLILTGYSTDELFNQSGGGMVDAVGRAKEVSTKVIGSNPVLTTKINLAF